MKLPSPYHVKRLVAKSQAAQTRGMARIAVGRMPATSEHLAKLRAVNPDLGHAATQMAQGKPAKMPNHAEYNDALHSAHKSMHKATAFRKASQGLAPVGKRKRLGV